MGEDEGRCEPLLGCTKGAKMNWLPWGLGGGILVGGLAWWGVSIWQPHDVLGQVVVAAAMFAGVILGAMVAMKREFGEWW